VLGGRGRLEVLLNGRPEKTIAVRGEPRLYTLLDLPAVTEGLLELRLTPGLSAYAFTFG
jgi:Thioredoxin like C-terminal domain